MRLLLLGLVVGCSGEGPDAEPSAAPAVEEARPSVPPPSNRSPGLPGTAERQVGQRTSPPRGVRAGSPSRRDPIEEAEAQAIRAAVATQNVDVKRCYEQRLAQVPGLRGAIHVDVSVVAGTVRSVTVAEDTVGDAPLAACVAEAIRSWSFPSSANEDLYLPFNFNAS